MIRMTDDDKYMAQLVAGDRRALRPLYERHGKALLRFSAAMCHSLSVAEDMVHDTFVELLRQPTNFDPDRGALFAYLCGVLRHRVSHYYRDQKRFSGFDEESQHESETPNSPAPIEEIAQGEGQAAFRRAMFCLPGAHREVIALCDLEELPYTTVAAILDCPVGTVRSRLHRARALLTHRLIAQKVIALHPETSRSPCES